MMGPIAGKAADARQFVPFRPSQVLYDLDGPKTFTFVPADGELYLAHWLDESATGVRYLVVPFSSSLLARLEAGRLSLREALDQPRVWGVDVDNGGEPVAATRTALEELPSDQLPAPGTLLTPMLEAISPARSVAIAVSADGRSIPTGTQAGS